MFKRIQKKCKSCNKHGVEKALFKAVTYKGTTCPNGAAKRQLCNDCWSNEIEDEENRNKNGGLGVVGDAWLKIRALDLPYIFNPDSDDDEEDTARRRRKKKKKKQQQKKKKKQLDSSREVQYII